MRANNRYTFIPLTAIVLFVLLYVMAALQYPGGSAVNPQEDGFSLRYNYLCDLLDTETIHGSLNTALYWARTGLLLLSTGQIYLDDNLMPPHQKNTVFQ